MFPHNPLWAAGISIFYPHPPQALTNLKTATLFSRIHVPAAASAVEAAIKDCPAMRNLFCLVHDNDVLIFDSVEAEHRIHVLDALRALADRGPRADVRRCVFDKASAREAGFELMPVDMGEREAMSVVLRERMAPDDLAKLDRQNASRM